MINFDQFKGAMPASKITPLDQVGWLAQEAEELRAWVAEAAHWRVFEADQLIYSFDDHSDGVYGLGSGSLELMFPLIRDEPVSLHLAEVGFWIGDAAELAGNPRIVSLTAASRSRLLHLPSRSIQKLLAAKPEYWPAFYRLSGINFRTLIRQYAEALSLTLRARVCRHLLRLTPPVIEITQDDLARLVGVARGTLRRCLTELASLGAIEIQYRKLRILDPAALSRFRNEQ
jgi:CRP/FNR family transcriptional regulator, cyclic AMP receptor protein